MTENYPIYLQDEPEPHMQAHYYLKQDKKVTMMAKKIDQLLQFTPPAPRLICQVTTINGNIRTGLIVAKEKQGIILQTNGHEQHIAISDIEAILPISFQS